MFPTVAVRFPNIPVRKAAIWPVRLVTVVEASVDEPDTVKFPACALVMVACEIVARFPAR